MPQYNPVYGELFTSREVSDLTGFTMNQLRNQRQKPETSPFPFVRIGGTSLYRKSDIHAWLDENGGLEAQYVALPHHKTTPLEISATDHEKREALARLTNINTENASSSMADWATDHSGLPSATKVWNDRGRQMLAMERGIADWKTISFANPDLKSADPEAYWKILVYGIRAIMNEVANLGVTDEEIMSLPIGQVPPARIK